MNSNNLKFTVVLTATIIISMAIGWFFGQSGNTEPTLKEYIAAITANQLYSESLYTPEERRQRYDQSFNEYNQLFSQRQALVSNDAPEFAEAWEWYEQYSRAQDSVEDCGWGDICQQARETLENLKENRVDACRSVTIQELHELNQEIEKALKQVAFRYNDLDHSDRANYRQAWVNLRDRHNDLADSDPAVDNLASDICPDLKDTTSIY